MEHVKAMKRKAWVGIGVLWEFYALKSLGAEDFRDFCKSSIEPVGTNLLKSWSFSTYSYNF